MWDRHRVETFAFIFDRGPVELLPCENFLNLPIVALKGKFALNINECLLPGFTPLSDPNSR